MRCWLQRCENPQRRLTARFIAPVGAWDPGLFRGAWNYGRQQVPPLGQQKVLTSETQSNDQPKAGSQHVGSWAQTAATQGSLQPVAHSAAPAVQTL